MPYSQAEDFISDLLEKAIVNIEEDPCRSKSIADRSDIAPMG